MKNFTSLEDVSDPLGLIKKAASHKRNPLADLELGKGKTLGLIFFNPSLRTRMSTIKAAQNLGMNVITLNTGNDSWSLETVEGVVMDQGNAEHIKEAAAVMGSYCDFLGIRSFPSLEDRDTDYQETLLKSFKKYANKPVISLESATLHPLQSLTDVLTIEDRKRKERPKVVLTWAPHIKALPQAVGNSFAQWINAMPYDFTIANPEGFDLSTEYTKNAKVMHDQNEALKGADFIYVKNWSSYENYGKVGKFHDWMIDQNKMKLTNQAYLMHCLPVRRNVVISDDTLDNEQSLVIEQAGNRVYAAQAVLSTLLENN